MQKRKASADELIALILQGIEDVKGHDIILLDLREIENMDYKEIAEILNIPIGTVKTRIFRARVRLQKIILEQD